MPQLLYVRPSRRSAQAGRPLLWRFEKTSHRGEIVARERPGGLGLANHVPPGCEPMQGHAQAGQALGRGWENAVVKDDQRVGDTGARGADGFYETKLAAAIGRQILDQEHAIAVPPMPFDLRAAAKTLGLLADID